MKKLSIIVPVYNEAKTINIALKRVIREPTPGWQKEIIVVDDGSIDGTTMLLKQWEKRVHVMYQPKNQGKGTAVMTGFAKAKGDVVIIQDADLEYSPKDYMTLLAPFADARVHVVYGSRFLGPHRHTMIVYELGNKFVTLMTNILYQTHLTDMETGYKAFRRSVAIGLKIQAKRFDFEPEFTAKLLKAGHKILEVPITYAGRKFSEGKKLTWRDGIAAVWTLIRLRI